MKKEQIPIGQQLSPVLEEIEATLLEHAATVASPPEFTPEGFRAGVQIFMAVMMDKLWSLQQSEDMPIENREEMAVKMGKDIRDMVKTYTDVDTFELYK